MSRHPCSNIHSGLEIYAFNMQMIQMARETNCHHKTTPTTTSTSSDCDPQVVHCNNFSSSHLFNTATTITTTSNNSTTTNNVSNITNRTTSNSTGKSATSTKPTMGLLSISLDTKTNCTPESNVISPSCQPISCFNPPPTPPSQIQPQQQQRQQQQQQQQVTCSHQGQQRRQFDDQSNYSKPTMAFSCTSKSSCSKQQLSGKSITTATTTTSSDDQLMSNGPSTMTDVIIKSSANSGYCSSFGSSSTSFFDDEETASHNCDNNHEMSGDDNENENEDNNVDADGLVDHVVADAGDVEEGEVDDDTDQGVTSKTSTSTSDLAMDEMSSNLLNATISGADHSFPGDGQGGSSYVNTSLPGDDDSQAYPINIQCGPNELTLMVEENLTAAYLVNILLLKFSLEEDVSWSLFMNLTVKQETSSTSSPIHLQCMIEDFEEVVPLFLKYQSFASNCKLVLRKAVEKLTMYHNLADFFDLNMVDLGEYGRIRSSSISFTSTSSHSGRSNSFDGSNSTIRKPSPVSVASSTEFQPLQRFLLISETFDLVVSSPVKVVKSTSPSTTEAHNAVLEKTQLTLSHVSSQSKDVIDFRSNRYDLFTPVDSVGEALNCFFLACPTEKCPLYRIICSNRTTTSCWIASLRLAKIGMQNMRRYVKTYKSSLAPQAPLQVHGSGSGGHLRHGSFSSKGSSVSSLAPSSPPSVASQVAMASRQSLHNVTPALVSPSSSSSSVHPSLHGPWFYENLTREGASKLLSQYSSINGVFLVRRSTRAPGTYVLSLVLNRKILHIIVMSMQIDSHTCYLTLDQGKTKFADLSQLIQFYQLNHSLLGCKLTHYVAKSH